MTDRRRATLPATLVIVALLTLAPLAGAGAQTGPVPGDADPTVPDADNETDEPSPTPDDDLSGEEAADDDPGLRQRAPAEGERIRVDVQRPVTFVIDPPGVLHLDDGRRYFDTVELRGAGPSGLINELDFDDYLAGIAEMPTWWPMEALKAQAVAARTYAWRAVLRGRYDGYDICATVACQVFRGADVVLGSPTGHRWREAVVATSREVLVDGDGAPILARYFSTSGGRTYANDEAFPNDGSYDYLQSFDDPYDEVSPYHRWNVTFTREEFDEILSRGDTLSAVSPAASAERLGEVDDPLASIRVTGRNGASVDVRAVAFRSFVSQVAASRFPDRFPGPRDDGEGPLPSTVPSSRFDIEFDEHAVVLRGQGWGHGVGMGQYGAMGRAEEGATYDEILAAYYGGLLPVEVDELPDRVRVATGLAYPLGIGGDTMFSIQAGGEVLHESVLGTWHVEESEGGTTQLVAPTGHGEDLEASETRHADAVPRMGDAATVEVDVNKPVFLDLEVTSPDGAVVASRRLGVVDAGTHAYTWRFDLSDGTAARPGTYGVALVAQDRHGERAGSPTTVVVPEPPPRADLETSTPLIDPAEQIADFGARHAAILGGLGLLFIAAALIARTRR